ncbi:MAG: LD-carboxypeptidase [Lachnospiraceae bacterium]|nr:LD-carboxypeptidase [Lachnospiraceae bacterium]
MNKVAIVACSNGQKREYEKQITELVEWFEKHAIEVQCSPCIYEQDGVFPGTVKERADALMKGFSDEAVEEIYDISGGDIANQILDFLDYQVIQKSKAVFWGYSDLTTIINAIYTMTGKSSVLFQVKNMVRGSSNELQQQRFFNRQDLFDPKVTFVNGEHMEGVVVGGNIRCFLKLAGTKYFPDLTDKVLLLEALGGDIPQISTYLAQLSQLGAFKKVSGILLGTFTALEKNGGDVCELVKSYAGELPIAKTSEIGHDDDSKAIKIGECIFLGNQNSDQKAIDRSGMSAKADQNRAPGLRKCRLEC